MSEPLVLVTGATGYVATHVTRQLQEDGWRVRATVRDPKNEKKVKPLNNLCPSAKFPLEIVEADLMNADSWTRAVEGCTYVMHIASPFPASNPKKADEVIKPAVDGTLNVLRACAAAKSVKRVVLTSSVAAVAAASGAKVKTIYNEDDWQTLEKAKGHFYTQSKIMAEKEAWKFVEELPEGEKFELAVVNPGFVLGPVLNTQVGASTDLLKQLLEKAIPRTPKIAFSLADVRDIALGHVRCMTVPEAAGKRHIICTEVKWVREVAAILDKEFKSQGYNIPLKDLPGPVASFAKVFNSDLRMIMRDYGVVITYDTARMRDVLRIQPRPVESTVIDMAYSMIEQGFVKKTDKYRGPSSSGAGAAI